MKFEDFKVGQYVWTRPAKPRRWRVASVDPQLPLVDVVDDEGISACFDEDDFPNCSQVTGIEGIVGITGGPLLRVELKHHGVDSPYEMFSPSAMQDMVKQLPGKPFVDAKGNEIGTVFSAELKGNGLEMKAILTDEEAIKRIKDGI